MGDGVDPLAATGSVEQDDRVGRIFSDYRLVQRIGKGGMATVYAAEHVRLGRMAAVKVIDGDLARDAKSIQRFRAEALTVAKLQHSNIVDVYDVGEAPEPHCLMELLRGRSLGKLISAEGALSEVRALYMAAQILGVLQVVHERGIVHRDIKPENIFVLDQGVEADHVKLLDFGIAKIRDGSQLGLSSSTGNAIIGTPMYMSPEQIEGRPPDARTDLYAFGLVLYEMLVGRPAFSAASLTALLSKQLLEMPPRMSSIRQSLSPRLEEVVERCLAKRPDDRFSGAAEVMAALDLTGARSVAIRWQPKGPDPEAIADTLGASSTLGRASGEVVASVRSKSARRRRRNRILIALGALGAVGGAGFLGSQLGHKPTPPSAIAPTVATAATTTVPPAAAPAATAPAAAPQATAPATSAETTKAAPAKHKKPNESWLAVARTACAEHDVATFQSALKHQPQLVSKPWARACSRSLSAPATATPPEPPPAPPVTAPAARPTEAPKSPNGAPIIELDK